MKIKTKKILITVLLCVAVVCSIVAICLATCIPDKKIIGNDADTVSTQSMDCATDDVQFLTDQDQYVKFGVKASNSITSANMKDYVTVTDVSGNSVSVTYSNGNICAPAKGYTPGGAYTISLKNGAKFVDSRFSDKEELVFLIHKDEVFNAVISESTNELSQNEYISFNGTDRLVLTTNKYKQGDIIKFDRTDYYNQSAAVKVVSSHQVYGGTEYVVEQPYLEEVFDELEVSECYDVHKEDFEINEEEINKLIGELENVPAMSDNGFLNCLPEIKLDIEPCDGGINFGLTIRFNIANIWKSKNGIGKAIADKITEKSNGAFTGSLNVYIVFKLQIKNEFEIFQDIELATGNFSTVTTKTTTTTIGFYLEVEGGILGASDDAVPKTAGTDEAEELNDLFDEFAKKYDLRKEIKIASLHATYMGLVGAGIDVSFVFGLSFNGKIGIENTMTSVHQVGMIVTSEGKKPVENKSTQYSNWGLSAYGIARAELGIKVELYIDFLVIFKAGICIEAGIYAEIGGAFAVEWGDGNVPTAANEEVKSYEQSVYSAMYFEAGVYFRASFFAEVNMFIIKFRFEYKFLDCELKFFELGSKECVTFLISEDDKKLVMENNVVDFPQIYVQKYNLFENTKSIEPVSFDDIELEYDNNSLTRTENGGFADVSGQTDAEYKLGVGLYDYKFANYGIGREVEFFSKSVIKRQKEAYIADSIEITIIKEPKDIESFELSCVGGVDSVEIGSSLVLMPINIQPYNATFSAIECSLKSPIDGVEILDNVLYVSIDAVPEQKIVISACTIKNRNEQVYSKEIEITIKDVKLSGISIYPFNASDMSEFKDGTIIPLGSDIKLNVAKYPENAKYTNLFYEILDGEQYLKNAYTGNAITSDGELSILDDLTENCKISIVAHATNNAGEEIISRTLTLSIQIRAIREVELIAESDIVHQGETLSLSVSLKPYTAEVDEIQYAIISGQSYAQIDKDTGLLTIYNSATIGAKIKVIAIADGVESEPFVFTVTEVFAENLTLVDSNEILETELHYGESIQLNVRIYPNDVTYTDYEYEILSGKENIYFNSLTGLITLKYNFDPTCQITLRVKKTLNDGKDTVIYSNIYTINVVTEALRDFYLLPNIDNILPGEEYKFEYSIKEDVIDKNSRDYIINCEYDIIEGADYALIDNLGVLRIDEEVAQQNYCIVLRCTLTTYNGVYIKDVKLSCKMVAKEITVSSESQQIKTSESIKLNVEVQPLSAYIKSVEYQLVQGDTYGSIDEEGILTANDALNVGKTISVRAIVTSVGVDPVSGEEIETVGYSAPYVLTIVEMPVESVEFTSTTLTLQQNESFKFVANVLPSTATYKNVNYSLIDSNNCAAISSDGTVTVKQTAKVGSIVTVVATSQSDSSILAQYSFEVAKATLIAFEIDIKKDNEEHLIAPGDEVKLMTKNPSPSYYIFDDNEVVYSVVSGDATIIGNKLTVGENAKADKLINVKAVAGDVVSYFDFRITVLSWTIAPTEVERGEYFKIVAEYEGESYAYDVQYCFADTNSHICEYGVIGDDDNNNLVFIEKWVEGGTEIRLIAKLGNIEIKHVCTVKKVELVVFDKLTDADGNSIDLIVEEDDDVVVSATSMLMYDIKTQTNKNDYLTITFKAYLSNGKTASSDSYLNTKNFSPIKNSKYIQISKNADKYVISVTQEAKPGDYAEIKLSLEGGAASCTLRVYVFVPAGNLNNGSLDNSSLKLLGGLVENASTLYVPSTVENNSTLYKAFKKGDTYDFGNYFKPTLYSPTNLAYTTTSGTITDAGIWTAMAGVTGGEPFDVTLTSSNTYKGRIFHTDNFERTCTFKMPNYIYTQSELSALNDKSDEYYLRNDLNLSGTWTPIETFSGKFDGGWHTISGFSYYAANESKQINLGFIINNYGTVKDLKIGSVAVSYTLNGRATIVFGGVVVRNYGNVSNCEIAQQNLEINKSKSSAGCVVWGNQANGKIINCINNMSINADKFVGGICGDNQGVITDCRNYGVISVTSGGTQGDIVGKGNAQQ